MAIGAGRTLGGRLLKQEQTRRRIVRSAQHLCLEAGFDGFTMDELATQAGVSRRTLFNYFPSKVDAVLGGGEPPQFSAPELAPVAETFRAGGPHGQLVEDLGELTRHLLASQTIDRESARLRRRVLTASPRLLTVIHERFEEVAEQLVDLVLEREGGDFGAVRARLAVGLLIAVFDVALDSFSRGAPDDPELAELFLDHIRLAGDLFTAT